MIMIIIIIGRPTDETDVRQAANPYPRPPPTIRAADTGQSQWRRLKITYSVVDVTTIRARAAG